MSAESEIQVRSRRYAALRSAQRVLGDGLHPTELERALEQGRSIRTRLQALSARAEEGAGDPASLQQVDRLLDRLFADTLGMLHRLGLEDGRHLFRRLAQEQPDQIRVVADLVVESDLALDQNLRLLEFLVTLLCCERSDEKKVVTCSPVQALPAVEGVYAGMRVELDRDASAAEQTFESATAELAQRDDVGEMRDRMRRYKRDLGVRMLHPQVFAALVAYNVAMSNRVEALIDEGGLQDELKQDLQELGPADSDPSDSLFDSEGFRRLVTALTQHLRGENCPDAPALRLARHCETDRLSPGEIEAFEAPEEESNARLARAALALGLVLTRLDESRPALAELGIDPEHIAGPWPAELWRSMTAAAQNLLADGRFAEAQRLAAVRGRQLDEHRASWGTSDSARPRVHGMRAPHGTQASPPESPFFLRTVVGVGLLIGLLLFAIWEWPDSHTELLTRGQLRDLSPYLESAHRGTEDGLPQLVGVLGDRWTWLGDLERRRAIVELGGRVEGMGITHVTLVDGQHQLQGRYVDGRTLWVARSPRR